MAWVERNRPWYDTGVDYCDVTGQLLPSRYWTFEVGGRTVRTVDPGYERIYYEHVLPRAHATQADQPPE